METIAYSASMEQQELTSQNQPKLLVHIVCSIVINIFAVYILLNFMESKFLLAMVLTVLISMLILPNILRWLTGSLDLYDPFAFISVVSYMIFCILPIGHMLLDFWYIRITGDIGMQMAGLQALTLLGYIVFLFLYRVGTKGLPKKASQVPFRIRRSSWNLMAVLQFIVVVPLIIYFQFRFGLLTGGLKEGYEGIPLGIGTLLSFTDAIVPVGIITLVINISIIKGMAKLKGYSILIFTSLIIVSYLGLRGSRGLMVTYLVWALGIVHYRIMRIPRWLAIVGMIMLIQAFAFYRVYKDLGIEGLYVIVTGGAKSYLQEKHIGSQTVLLTEISRTDTARFIIQETRVRSDFPYQYGKSYIMAFVSKIPRFIWRNKPFGLARDFDNLEYGKGHFEMRRKKSAKVTGFIGETVFNFSVVSIPFMFGLFGFLAGRYTRWVRQMDSEDDRKFLLPIITYVVAIIFLIDSSNTVAALIRYAMIPGLMIWMCKDRSNIFQYEPEYESEYEHG